MTHLSRRNLIIVLGLGAALSCPQRAWAGDSWRTRLFEAVSAAGRERVETGAAPGLAVGVSAPGFRKMAFHGLSDIDARTPVTESTRFRIASVTKPMTAAAVLVLRDRGALDLDQSIDAYFPDFPDAGSVTIRHLLAHTSGLANWWGRLPSDVRDDFMDKPRPHAAVARMRPTYLFEPGVRWSYSNTGYLLLGEIIEQVSGKPYEDAMRELLFAHCGAGGIALEVTNGTGAHWAEGYQGDRASGWARVSGTPMPYAAGGLRSNLHDVLAASDALFHDRLLAYGSLAEMTAHARNDEDRLVQDVVFEGDGSEAGGWPAATTEMGYGLGVNTWVQGGERFFSHAGLIDGFSAYLIHAPRTLTTAVVLSNGQAGTPPLHQLIRDHMIDAPAA